MGYAGLPRGTVGFLAGLDAENDRGWFEAHRAEYERDFLGGGLDLVAALSGPCAELGLLAVPKTNGSLRRIFRDVRFSKDKRPYEPRLHIILSTRQAFNKVSGVHLVISGQGIGYGAGWYGLEPAALEGYRQRILDPVQRDAFKALLSQAATVGARLDAPDLARVPKGYEPAPWDSLLRRKSVIVRTEPVAPHPDWLFGPDAVSGWMAIVGALAPLARWLVPAD
ncbi:MAG: DUF2461 domain-containing protein [bacterium]